MPAKVTLEPGQIVDRYQVEAVLGEGGLATIYLVKHSQLGSRHALKVMNVPRSQRSQRLLQEGRAQAVLQHPNVVNVTDVLEVEGHPALLMDYVPGLALDQWLERHQPTVREAVSLFRKILDAVHAAHSVDMIHRDLKPANVMMEELEERWVPRVADFGLVKMLRDLGADEELTRSGVGMGTPAYSAPEQLRDARNVDARADVFSLGCIFYELVCGQRAFPGRDPLAVAELVFTGAYARPESLQPGLPFVVIDTIDGCLDPDPDQRFNNCEEVRGSLRKSAGRRRSRRRRRKRGSAVRVAGCLSVGFLLGFVVALAVGVVAVGGLVWAGLIPIQAVP